MGRFVENEDVAGADVVPVAIVRPFRDAESATEWLLAQVERAV
jgi:hypothetical protein